MSDTNTRDMVGIPPALDRDAEDVVWALQTAEALWKRNERIDAIVWLRRAAQAAGDSEDDDRALALARDAAELAEWVANNPQAGPVSLTPPRPSDSPGSGGGVEDLLRASQAEIDVVIPVDGPAPAVALPPPQTPLPPPAPPPPPPPPPPARVEAREAEPEEESSDGPTDVEKFDSLPPVAPSAADAHAGMLDPWADGEAPTRDRSAPRAPPPPAFDEDEVITSAPPATGSTPAPRIPSPPPPAPPPVPAPAAPPPLPPRPAPSLKKLTAPPAPPVVAPPRASKPVLPPPAPDSDKTLVASPAPPAPKPSAKPPAAPPAPAPAPPAALDLSGVEAFADLPDDARAAFAAAATLHDLARDEEVSQIALALVLEGDVDVAATIVDAPAHRLARGAVLRMRGTLDHKVALRLLGASDHAKIATWDDAAVEAALGTCPWVEDDLRAAGDRVQALAGATMGLLGERLDTALRAQVTDRLSVRALAEGEVFVEKGKPVHGLLVVCAGELEIGDDATLSAGDFLFPTAVMAAGEAPATARAGKGGALVLVGDRHVAQELLVTCPPLLEIFAGM